MSDKQESMLKPNSHSVTKPQSARGHVIARLVLVLCLIVLLTTCQMTPTYGQQQSSPASTSLSDAQLRRALAEALDQLVAAKEQLAAADALINSQDDELKASDRARELATQERSSLERIVQLKTQEAESLRAALAAKDIELAAVREQSAVAQKEASRQTARADAAKKRTKWATIGGIVAGVLIGLRF